MARRERLTRAQIDPLQFGLLPRGCHHRHLRWIRARCFQRGGKPSGRNAELIRLNSGDRYQITVQGGFKPSVSQCQGGELIRLNSRRSGAGVRTIRWVMAWSQAHRSSARRAGWPLQRNAARSGWGHSREDSIGASRVVSVSGAGLARLSAEIAPLKALSSRRGTQHGETSLSESEIVKSAVRPSQWSRASIAG